MSNILCFELSMPNVGSWNGKWTGESDYYIIIKKLTRSKKSTEKADKLCEKASWYYNFGDGWGASVSVKRVDSKTAAKMRRKSKGFYGYDWMVDTILIHGEILSNLQLEEKRKSEKQEMVS